MAIDEVAGRVSVAADELTGTSLRLGLVGPPATAFAGDGPGRLGELGRDLHAVWDAALAAREREVAAHAARLTDLAAALRMAADGYREADAAGHRRHRAVG